MISTLKSIVRPFMPRGMRLWLRRLYHYGNRVECPMCGSTFRSFAPFGIPPRPDAYCMKCGSLERHRLLVLFLKERTNLFRDQLRLLEFAPIESMSSLFKAAPNLEYVTGDIIAHKAMVQLDILDLPFSDGFFDAILCSHVLEHIENEASAVKELYRVLKPGGWAIIQVPVEKSFETTYEDPSITSPEDRQREFRYWQHVRLYGRDFPQRLAKGGFKAQTVEYTREIGEAAVKRYGLTPGEDIYFCTKE